MPGRRLQYLCIRGREIRRPSVCQCWSHASRCHGQQARNLYIETVILLRRQSRTDNYTDISYVVGPVMHSFGCHIRHLLPYHTIIAPSWTTWIPHMTLSCVWTTWIPHMTLFCVWTTMSLACPY